MDGYPAYRVLIYILLLPLLPTFELQYFVHLYYSCGDSPYACFLWFDPILLSQQKRQTHRLLEPLSAYCFPRLSFVNLGHLPYKFCTRWVA